MMTPQEVMRLWIAYVSEDGEPRCQACAPVDDDLETVRVNFDRASAMVVDVEQPAICACPKCGTRAQTPAALAIDILTQQVSALKEQLARDPIAQAMVSGRATHGSSCFLLPNERRFLVRDPDGKPNAPHIRRAIVQIKNWTADGDERGRLLGEANKLLAETEGA